MAKLRTAFGAIDRLFADFITREHVPGAAWGIVIDGELAHVGRQSATASWRQERR